MEQLPKSIDIDTMGPVRLFNLRNKINKKLKELKAE